MPTVMNMLNKEGAYRNTHLPWKENSAYRDEHVPWQKEGAYRNEKNNRGRKTMPTVMNMFHGRRVPMPSQTKMT